MGIHKKFLFARPGKLREDYLLENGKRYPLDENL